MKKTFLAMTALAAMLFAGCTSSDDLTTRETITKANEAATPINFGTYMGKTGTRAGSGDDITSAQVLAQKGGFGVFAYYTESTDYNNTVSTGSQTPNFMYNQLVTGTDVASPVWSYNPVKYWPNQYNTGNVDNQDGNNENANAQAASNEGKVSFFAYAPYTAVNPSTGAVTGASGVDNWGITALSANDYNHDPTVTYKLAADGSGKFVDLLWGIKSKGSPDVYNVNLTKNSANLTSANKDGKVSFLFRHALTKVGGSTGLKIVYDIDANGTGETGGGSNDSKTLVTVSDITIQNAAGNIIKTGVFDLATGVWAATTESGTAGDLINLHFTKDGGGSTIPLNTAIAETTPAYSGTAWTTPTNGGVKASEAKNVYNADANPFYLIPGNADQKLNVTITYIVRTYDSNLATSASGGEGTWTKVTQTISNVVTLPTTLLQPNKKITLVIHLGLTSVKFTAEVDSWEAVEGASAREVWLPSNVE